MLTHRLYLALAAIALLGCDVNETSAPPSKPPPPPAAKPAAKDIRAVPVASYAEAVERVSGGVVTIRAARRSRAPRQHPFFDHPALRDFFGAQQRGRDLQLGLGSGVIVKPDGVILTNFHVIDGAEAIRVELQDHRSYEAKIVGTDPPSDLAVLKIDARELPALDLGDSDNVRVGDVVLAVGNPLGIGQTVTAGIISAKGRATGLSDGSFEDFLQTDAPINQGNSGGALVNTEGELVGINSQILSTSGGSIGIGFAVPSNMARNVLEQLVATGKVRRGQLGIAIQPLTAELASSFGVDARTGVVINSVSPGSAAARAGLRQGDVLLQFNGEPITDGNTLRNRVAGSAPGTEVTLTIVRDKRERQVEVTLGEYAAKNATG